MEEVLNNINMAKCIKKKVCTSEEMNRLLLNGWKIKKYLKTCVEMEKIVNSFKKH